LVLGVWPKREFVVVGHMLARKAMVPKYWTHLPNNRPPLWLVPQDDLIRPPL
jgi:hypothetical protein